MDFCYLNDVAQLRCESYRAPLPATSKLDYIIVGQGLAGSCLALQLLEAGRKILVIDKPDEHSASRVAAGLFNPITGKVLSKTWLADTLFPYLQEFYSKAEQCTHAHFFHPMPLYRPFISIEEQNEWMGKSAEPAFLPYTEAVPLHPIDPEYVRNPLGGMLLKHCGYLHTHHFLLAVRNHLTTCGKILNEPFDERDLRIMKNEVHYREFTASKIIFCQGEKAIDSNLFSWLPIRRLKGETLSIATSEKVSKIYNRGVYVVPNLWKVGATYNTKDLTPAITTAGYEELSSKLKELLAFPYEITGQSWGFRPTTPDRKPILGAHPAHPEVVIFNGLGTKGVSLAPYFSKVLLNWLENGQSINKEVDIERYKEYYYAGNLLK